MGELKEIGILLSELLIRFALFPCANSLREVFEPEPILGVEEEEEELPMSGSSRRINEQM
jgi:hypothetical protein